MRLLFVQSAVVAHLATHVVGAGELNFTSCCDWLSSEQLRLILVPVRVGQPLPVPLN